MYSYYKEIKILHISIQTTWHYNNSMSKAVSIFESPLLRRFSSFYLSLIDIRGTSAMLSVALISLWIIIIPRRAWTAVYARTRVPSPRRAVAVAREFDDGITSHWFPVYNAPEINVRSVGPPVNINPHDGYACLIYLYVNPATLRPIDTPDISPILPSRLFAQRERFLCGDHAILCGYHTHHT